MVYFMKDKTNRKQELKSVPSIIIESRMFTAMRTPPPRVTVLTIQGVNFRKNLFIVDKISQPCFCNANHIKGG